MTTPAQDTLLHQGYRHHSHPCYHTCSVIELASGSQATANPCNIEGFVFVTPYSLLQWEAVDLPVPAWRLRAQAC